jgi:nucleoside-diphosphate-sugar epimerase
MRLLMTGASGFVGRNMLLAAPPEWEIIALHSGRDASFPSWLAAHGLSHVTPIACDLTQPAQVAEMAQNAGNAVDVCLYLASNTSIARSLEFPLDDLAANVAAVINVLTSWQIGHLVYFSTGSVYIGIHGRAHPSLRLQPNFPYAISKLTAEYYTNAFQAYRASPERVTILRFFGAFGPYEPPRKFYTGLVTRFAVEGDPHFTVVGDGGNIIYTMYVADTVGGVLAVLNDPHGEPYEIYDFGRSNRETINDVVMRAGHTFGLEPIVEHTGTTAEYIDFYIDPEPFRERFGFTPTVTLEDGLHRLAEHLTHEHS